MKDLSKPHKRMKLKHSCDYRFQLIYKKKINSILIETTKLITIL